jgi:hypothetical protein
MKIISLLFLLISAFPLFHQAQNPKWELLGLDIDLVGDVVEEFQGELYFGGFRYSREGSFRSNFLATDGENTRLIHGLMEQGYEGDIEAMLVRNGSLYISVREGRTGFTSQNSGIFKFDGQEFTLIAERRAFGAISNFTVFKDTIYIRASFELNNSQEDILFFANNMWQRTHLTDESRGYPVGTPIVTPVVTNDTLKAFGHVFRKADKFDKNGNPLNQLEGIAILTDTGWIQDKSVTKGFGYTDLIETPFGKFSRTYDYTTFGSDPDSVEIDSFQYVQTKSNNNEKWKSIGAPNQLFYARRVMYANNSIFQTYMEDRNKKDSTAPIIPIGSKLYLYQDEQWKLFNEEIVFGRISDYAYYKGYLYIVGQDIRTIGSDPKFGTRAKILLDKAFDRKLEGVSDNFIGHKNTKETFLPVENDKYPTGQRKNLSIKIIQSPSNGDVVILPTNLEIEYTPDQDFFGFDSLVYSLCHKGLCDTAIINFRIKEKANMHPVAQEDFFTFPDSLLGTDQIIELNLFDNDYSPDGDQIRLNWFRHWKDEYGEYALFKDGRIKILTKKTTEKTIRLIYEVCDEEDSCRIGSVNIDFVPPPNSAPILENDIFSVLPGKESTLDVLKNDFDPENDSLYLKLNSSPANGLISLTSDSQQVVYNAHPSFIGKESFLYTACDIAENCRNALVTINVVEELPTFVNQNREETSPYTLFPNPVQNTLNINFTAPIKHGEIQIFTIAGQAILSEKLMPKSSHTLNLDALNKGVYLIQVNVNGKTNWDRFIKG